MSKQVSIKRLDLTNFKGVRGMAVDFTGAVTTISGRNGSGKTTIKDAFNWLLWGKDSEGNADSKFGIKTNDAEGNPIPDLEHEVKGFFEVVDTATGEMKEYEFKRCLVEEWKVPSGSTERQLKGHHTDYFCNGVPMKKTDYEKKIADIIPEDLFKVITDPFAFLSLHWKTQRETLLQMAGEVDRNEIANQSADFGALLAKLSDKTLEEYRAEVSANKRRINERMEKIPTAIDAIVRVTPQGQDFAALEAKKAELEAEQTEIDAASASISEANRQAYERTNKIQAQINSLRSQQQTIIYDAQDHARRQAYETNARARELDLMLARIDTDLRAQRQAYEATKTRCESTALQLAKQRDGYKQQMETLRTEWHATNAAEFQSAGAAPVCPLFGHACADAQALQLYASSQEQTRAKYAQDKAKKLADITTQGKTLGEYVAAIEQQIAANEAERQDNENRNATIIESLQSKRQQYAAERAGITLADEHATIAPEQVPGWAQAEEQIKQLTLQLNEAGPATNEDAGMLQTRRNANRAALSETIAALSQRETIERNEAQVKELRAEASQLAQELATLQMEEDAAARFETALMDEVERRVNALFSRVQFRMYRTQIEDAKRVPDCVCYVGGVRFADLNHAAQVNAGLDVINTLAKKQGVSAPIFVDNAESVNTFIPVEAQLVRLEVSKGDFKVKNN